MYNDIDQMHFIVLHIGEACCCEEWNYKNICSPFTRLYYVTKGHAQIELPDKVQDLRPDFMYIVPAFTTHSYICHEEFCHYYIHIYNESAHDILEDWLLPSEIPSGTETLAIIKRLHELCPQMSLTDTDPKCYEVNPELNINIMKNKRRDFYARVESRGIVYQLLAAFLSGARPRQYVGDSRITKILDYIRANLDRKIDLDSLASVSCLSKDHLIRVFKREIKMTPGQYIIKKKVEKAQLWLLTEDDPVKEIAYRLGFDDQTYFNRIFKKTSGLTPAHYRELCRNAVL